MARTASGVRGVETLETKASRQRERVQLVRASLYEGAREVLVTLLATLAIGLGWAALEAGQANSALARDGIPSATEIEAEGWIEADPAQETVLAARSAVGDETGYARGRMERR